MNIRREYKIVVLIVFITLIFFAIFLIVETKNKKNNPINYRTTCQSKKISNGINYIDNRCVFTDDFGSQIVLSYPILETNNKEKSIVSFNKKIEEFADGFKKNIKYEKVNEKYKFIYLKNYTYSLKFNEKYNIVSLVMTDKIDNYNLANISIYNISVSDNKIIEISNFKNIIKFDVDKSIALRAKVKEFYSINYNYNYDLVSTDKRNQIIDKRIENIYNSNINLIFINEDNSIGVIIDLYSPDDTSLTNYLFTIYDEENISYKKLEE